MTETAYLRPALRAHCHRRDLPSVVAVHQRRCVASGLRETLAGRAEVVGDTIYGAAALQLAEILTPDVVVTNELLGDGLIDHFLPTLLRAGTRVMMMVDDVMGDRVVDLVGRGLTGICTTDAPLPEVATCVLQVAEGGVVLPPALTAIIVSQWRSASSTDMDVTLLTTRELDVYNALRDGLSTKATARRLGVAIKTVENYRTRLFTKLGVRNQAQLVANMTGSLTD